MSCHQPQHRQALLRCAHRRTFMSSTGLQRRRVGASSSTPTSFDDDEAKPYTPSNGLNSPPATSHAGSAFEGGSKIAYDPRDLEDAEDEVKAGGKMPRLTIMEEVLLLGLKDKQVSLWFWSRCLTPRIHRFLGLWLSFSHRDTSRFGTITYLMHCEAAYSSNWR